MYVILIVLFGVFRLGDEFFYIMGKLYDMLEEIVGVRGGENVGLLKDF